MNIIGQLFFANKAALNGFAFAIACGSSRTLLFQRLTRQRFQSANEYSFREHCFKLKN